jgi:plastocyanin
LRKYYIKVENDKFMPSKVIVNQGDIISIKFFAVDKDYDIQLPDYNMSKGLKQKEPSAFEFEANMTGLFRYYCDLC